MSRHTYTGNAGTTVAIGWDRPLATFFVQVLRPHLTLKGEDDMVEWQGTEPDELPTAAAAIEIAARYADLPEDLGAKLETDRLKTLGTADGPAQRAVRPFQYPAPPCG
ncbi:hypothetical protein C8J46_106116 [Sphingomonas sp. PP-F2F-A104-K0414]|uniref:hypothetical protein n=1 Tax=Sphingomonas sp. PP-F2F-A104-K0414 TaxID=2135661 RepID=UPI00104DA138|nr:hypothetical protein [Sphingomonas sp. PP-F2F-A104-K0414]TCP97493.1 hypothetical protein C8J46_106116 [Sphingomonas sp. PP-F2F-A104-K0414]